MTKQEAKDRIADLRKQGKTVFDLTFQEECMEFFKEDVKEIPILETDIHVKTWPKGEVIDYTKNFIMKLGREAGIIVVDSVHKKEGKYIHNSTCYVRRITPKGTNQELNAEGCFDVEPVFDIEKANDAIEFEKWKDAGSNGKQEGGKYLTKNPVINENLKMRRMAELLRKAGQLADTNAHQRAIKKMLDLPPATQKISKGKDKNGYNVYEYIMVNSVIFISCVIPNTDKKEVADRLLAGYFGGATGKQLMLEEKKTLALPEAQTPEQTLPNNGNTIQGESEEPTDDFDTDASDGFGDTEPEPEVDYVLSLQEMKNNPNITQNKAVKSILKIIDAAIENKTQLKECFELCLEFVSTTDNRSKMELFLNLCLFHPAIGLKQDVSKKIAALLDPKINNSDKALVDQIKACRNVLEVIV